MSFETITITPGSRFRTAMVLAIVADALQVIVFPFFAEGALSPADDLLDFAVAGVLVRLLGWHWEFLPSFLGKLVPGVDVVPFWTLRLPTYIANRSGLQSRELRKVSKKKNTHRSVRRLKASKSLGDELARVSGKREARREGCKASNNKEKEEGRELGFETHRGRAGAAL